MEDHWEAKFWSTIRKSVPLRVGKKRPRYRNNCLFNQHFYAGLTTSYILMRKQINVQEMNFSIFYGRVLPTTALLKTIQIRSNFFCCVRGILQSVKILNRSRPCTFYCTACRNHSFEATLIIFFCICMCMYFIHQMAFKFLCTVLCKGNL